MTSVLSNNVVNRATSFVVYALVARTLGPDDLGRLALAVSLMLLFSAFVVAGVTTVTTRGVSRDGSTAGPLLVSASLVVSTVSIAGYVAMLAVVRLLRYEADTTAVILIIFAGLLPYSLTRVNQAVFIGRQEARLIFWTTAPLDIGQTALVAAMVAFGSGIREIAWTLVGSYALQALIQFLILARRVPLQGFPRLGHIRGLLKAGFPFLGIQSLNAVASSGTIIVLSALGSETDVGLLTAAFQLIVPVRLMSEATSTAAFPVIARSFREERHRMPEIVRRVIEATQAAVTPATVGLMVLATPITVLVYGPGFADTADLVRIIAVTGFTRGFTSALGQMLWATNRETTALRISAIQASFHLGASYAFIATFGLVGAAWTAVAVAGVNVLQHWLPVRHELGVLDIGQAIWRSVAASSVMAALILTVPDLNVFALITFGVVVYGGALFGLYRARSSDLLDEFLVRAD